MEYRQNFRALQAFEAVSRHLSVSRAAQELGVTQSAVSHQLRLLTGLVGEKLLRKDGRRIALTVAGASLAVKLQPAFAAIEKSVEETIGKRTESVRLAVCSSFGPGWLIPRLGEFFSNNPVLDLKLLMYDRDPELTDTVADAFVTTLPREKGFFTLFIATERLVPVVSTSRARQNVLPLITTDLMPGHVGADWHTHQELVGPDAALVRDGRWLFASHYVTALEMVRAGLGAALVPDFLVARDVEAGTLQLLDQSVLLTGDDYYFCVKESRRDEVAIDTLVRWFKGQIARQAQTADAIPGV